MQALTCYIFADLPPPRTLPNKSTKHSTPKPQRPLLPSPPKLPANSSRKTSRKRRRSPSRSPQFRRLQIRSPSPPTPPRSSSQSIPSQFSDNASEPELTDQDVQKDGVGVTEKLLECFSVNKSIEKRREEKNGQKNSDRTTKSSSNTFPMSEERKCKLLQNVWFVLYKSFHQG